MIPIMTYGPKGQLDFGSIILKSEHTSLATSSSRVVVAQIVISFLVFQVRRNYFITQTVLNQSVVIKVPHEPEKVHLCYVIMTTICELGK